MKRFISLLTIGLLGGILVSCHPLDETRRKETSLNIYLRENIEQVLADNFGEKPGLVLDNLAIEKLADGFHISLELKGQVIDNLDLDRESELIAKTLNERLGEDQGELSLYWIKETGINGKGSTYFYGYKLAGKSGVDLLDVYEERLVE